MTGNFTVCKRVDKLSMCTVADSPTFPDWIRIVLSILASGHVKYTRWLRYPTILLGTAVLAFWIIGTLIAPLVISYDPLDQNINDSLQTPGAQHWWGADK